jgi:hypothetical protein
MGAVPTFCLITAFAILGFGWVVSGDLSSHATVPVVGFASLLGATVAIASARN